MTIALIDGDVIAHLACEGRMQGINALEFVKSEFREDFLKRLEIDGPTLKLLTVDDIIFTPEQDEAYLERAWKCFMKVFKECLEANFTDEHRMAMKGESNFRDNVYAKYKIHRSAKPEKRNKFVPMMRERAVREGLAEFAVNMEADDLLRIWYEEYNAAGRETVICSIDKDLKCMPTQHYNIKKATHFKVSNVEAELFYHQQLLQGDGTDGIKGIPGVGPVKAEKLLSGLTEVSDMQRVVQLCYYHAFGPRWREELILNGSLIYILKTRDDKFSIDNWTKADLDEETPETELIQKVIKVDVPLTIERALAIVDPASIVGIKQWNAAMEFLMLETSKLKEDEENALDALEVITTRGKIPPDEVAAHAKLKGMFSKLQSAAGSPTGLPLSFAKTSVATEGKTPAPPVLRQASAPPAPTTPPPKFNLPVQKASPEAPKAPAPVAAAPAPPKFNLPPSVPKVTPVVTVPAAPPAEKPKFVFKRPG